MKKLLLFFALAVLCTNSKAQDYLGLSTGNYSGIQGVMLQPANVADNRYKWELNIVSTNIGFQNNYIGLSRDYFMNNRFSFKDFNGYDDFKSKVLTENSITGNNVQLNLNNRLNLPSVLISTGKKSGIAIGLQSRTSVAVDNMNPAFAKQLYDEFKNSSTYNQYYNLNGLDISALNWFEGSFTYGRVLLNKGKHFLKAGVTVKYLGGVSSWYLQADDMSVAVNSDSAISLRGNSVRYGHSKTNISGQILKEYEPDASGLGFDAGIVYEYRGRIDKFKFLKLNKDEQEVYTSTRRDKNKYAFKLGISLLDAGKLTFTSTPLARDFSSNVNNINIKNIGLKNVQDLDTFISQNVNYLSAQTGQQYSVAMPTALSAQVDLHLFKGFYVNALAYMPFKSLNKNTDYRVFTPNYYAVTPRWESRVAGLYVPIVYNNNHNEDRDITIGSTVRLGPLFVGSSNLLTLFKKDNIQSADLHVGFKLPFAHGKPSKVANWFKKFTNEPESTTIISKEEKVISRDTVIEKEKEIIEKKDPVSPIQIIINNYNGVSKEQSKRRVIDVDPTTGETKEQVIILDENKDNELNDNSASEPQEFKNMQEQIEYLKFKLKQKELLLDEIKKEQELIKNNSSTEESKKKIDSLRSEYLFNNDFDYVGVDWQSDSSTVSLPAALFELRKDLISLEQKNSSLDKTVVQLAKQNEALLGKVVDIEKRKSIEDLNSVVRTVRDEEYRAVNPRKVEFTPTYNTNKSYERTNNESNVEYESLRREIRILRSELKEQRKANKKGKRNWQIFRGEKGRASQNKGVSNLQIQRDTIYIEKPVEKVVTQIVRDTVTNTVEKNNVITKTETKVETIEIDNTERRLLEMPPYFVLFDVGSASIKTIYRNKLNYYASQLQQYPDLNIKLTGHADATGNAQKNLALSKRRALQVRNYLIQKGINRTRVTNDFSGDQDPLADNKTKVGKSQNRRVEVLFTK